MNKRQLYEFAVYDIKEVLENHFGDKATTFWNDKEEFQCGGCSHKDTYVYVLAISKKDAVQVLQDEQGLCSQCIANMIANGNYSIIGDGL